MVLIARRLCGAVGAALCGWLATAPGASSSAFQLASHAGPVWPVLCGGRGTESWCALRGARRREVAALPAMAGDRGDGPDGLGHDAPAQRPRRHVRARPTATSSQTMSFLRSIEDEEDELDDDLGFNFEVPCMHPKSTRARKGICQEGYTKSACIHKYTTTSACCASPPTRLDSELPCTYAHTSHFLHQHTCVNVLHQPQYESTCAHMHTCACALALSSSLSPVAISRAARALARPAPLHVRGAHSMPSHCTQKGHVTPPCLCTLTP